MANTDRGTKISGYVPPMCLARLKDIATERDSSVEALVEYVMQDFAVSDNEGLAMPGLRKDARKMRATQERKPVRTLKGRTGSRGKK